MPDEITRQEYNQSLERIHTRIDDIQKTAIQIETSAKHIEESVKDMHKVIFGDGRNGLIAKVTKLFERVSLHTKIIVGALLAIIGGFVTLVVRIIK